MTEALDTIILRLERIISHYDLTASAFAERIGVQRSSISHLLSGRNKPSLEFVLKVTSSFPEVNLEWLLLGVGDFISDSNKNHSKRDEHEGTDELRIEIPASESSYIEPSSPAKKNMEYKLSEVTLERIVFFYSNGTFSTYRPENSPGN